MLDHFATLGYSATAVSLRGHGGSHGTDRLRWTSTKDYLDDIDGVVQSQPSEPVLIGHSMGGFLVQHYLEDHHLPGGALLASVPPSGVWPTSLRIARQYPKQFARSNATLSLYPLVETPELVRRHFFSDELSDVDVQRHHDRLGDESFRAFVDMLGLNLPKPSAVRTPMLVIGAERDAIISPAQVAKTAAAYGTTARMVPIAHDVMLDPNWRLVADVMHEWLLANER